MSKQTLDTQDPYQLQEELEALPGKIRRAADAGDVQKALALKKRREELPVLILQARIAWAEFDLREMEGQAEREASAVTEAAENFAAVKAEVEETIREANERLKAATTQRDAALAERRRSASAREQKKDEVRSLRRELNQALGLEAEPEQATSLSDSERRRLTEEAEALLAKLKARGAEEERLRTRRDEIQQTLLNGRERGVALTEQRRAELKDEAGKIAGEQARMRDEAAGDHDRLSRIESTLRQDR